MLISLPSSPPGHSPFYSPSQLLEQNQDEHLTLLTSYSHLQVLRYVTVSAIAFFVWETAVNFSREIDLVWRSKWSLVKILYLLARYTAYVATGFMSYAILFDGSMTHAGCELELQLGWPCILSMVITTLILQMRVHAIYYQRKRIRITVTILFIVAYIPAVVMFSLRSATQIQPIIGTSICTGNFPNILYYTLCTWIAPTLFEFVLLTLICYESYQHYQGSIHVGESRGFRLMRVICRDSVIYFLVGFALYLMNALIWLMCPPEFIQLGTVWTVMGSAAAATRMILNLREENYLRASPASLTTMTTPN